VPGCQHKKRRRKWNQLERLLFQYFERKLFLFSKLLDAEEQYKALKEFFYSGVEAGASL